MRERVKHVHATQVIAVGPHHTVPRLRMGQRPTAPYPFEVTDDQLMDEDMPPDDVPGSDLTDVASQQEPPTTPRRPRWPLVVGLIALITGLGVLVVLQLQLISTLDDTRTELDATRSQLVDLEGQIDDVSASVDRVATDIAGLGTNTPSTGTQPTPSIPAGHLPRHVQGQQDTALGLTLGPIEGPDAYTGATSLIEPADGTKRIWMVWAHWCPYCQQELPELSAMYGDLATTYPSIEIATITTSIDPDRGNPLDEYLGDQQFPFPVVVDDDLRLASQMGVSAFPFWLVTDGDGTVLLRLSGYLEPARVLELAATLDGYES